MPNKTEKCLQKMSHKIRWNPNLIDDQYTDVVEIIKSYNSYIWTDDEV